MNRLVDLESLGVSSPYHVLDMLRIPVSLFPVVLRLCEVLVRSRRADMRGQEAVVEVLLHPAVYFEAEGDAEDPDAPDVPRFLGAAALAALAAEVRFIVEFDRRSPRWPTSRSPSSATSSPPAGMTAAPRWPRWTR